MHDFNVDIKAAYFERPVLAGLSYCGPCPICQIPAVDGREELPDYRSCASSVFDADNVRLDLSIDLAPSESLGNGLRRQVGRFAEPRLVLRLDLVA